MAGYMGSHPLINRVSVPRKPPLTRRITRVEPCDEMHTSRMNKNIEANRYIWNQPSEESLMPANLPLTQPTSVSLKINRTSVMLYANRYVRLPDGSGASSQSYLGSFPVAASELPAAFESLLRAATVGRPERYRALVQRIETDVLIPARQREAEETTRRNLQGIENALRWAAQNLQAIPGLPAYNELIDRPELQQLLAKLLESSARLASSMQQAMPTPSSEPNPVPEEHLKALMTVLENTCLEIGTLLPESAQVFKRGHIFERETVALVKRLWFRTSDVIARLGSRAQFRRPAGWSALRPAVLEEERELAAPGLPISDGHR